MRAHFHAACLLLACALPLTAAEKKKAPDPLLSPDGRYRVKLEIVTPSGGGREQDATLVDAKTGATLLELESAAGPYTEGTRVLWSPDSQRFAYVTQTRRGEWTDCIVHNGDKWENAQLPTMPGFEWKGHRSESKTILASYGAVRWSKPNVLLIVNEVEDDDGKSAKVHFALTFDAQNHITAERVKK